MKVQNSWSYLEPVFSSDDIMKAMPNEGMLFRQVDMSWRKMMADVSTDLRVRNVTNINGV